MAGKGIWEAIVEGVVKNTPVAIILIGALLVALGAFGSIKDWGWNDPLQLYQLI